VDYCESYRPAARRGTPPDTGMSHIGFRCVKSVTEKSSTPDENDSKIQGPGSKQKTQEP
jgi:hypothetical protein